MQSTAACERYEQLIEAARNRELTDEEGIECLEHEDNCPTGKHKCSLARLEEELGVPEGVLTHGSPEHGIPSLEEGRNAVIQKLRTLGLLK